MSEKNKPARRNALLGVSLSLQQRLVSYFTRNFLAQRG